MRILVLLVTFALSLFGKSGCISCHQEHSQNMTSACSICHTNSVAHKKDNLQKTSPVTLQNYQKFFNDDKPILLSYQGLLQKEYGSKKLLHMQSDIHFKKGMLCQDCHTSNELHSDGFWLAKQESEISCQDCHGTTRSLPWELPLKTQETPRGVVDENNASYLVNSAGVALGNVLKKEQTVVIALASGKELELQPLKLLKEHKALSKNAVVAMENISAHRDSLACSSCHTLWAPQFYGSTVKTNHRVKSKRKRVTKSSTFMRWDEPFLVQNSDGKIVPATPKTPLKRVEIDKKGKVSVAGNENLLEAVSPHTIQKASRSCESCHSSTKVLSGSIDTGAFQEDNTTHFNLSKVLSQQQLDKLDRRGVCLSCHEEIPSGNLAISTISHVSQMMELDVGEKEHKLRLNRVLNMSAWFQIILVLFVVLIFVYLVYTMLIKKKSINPRNRGWK